MGLKLISAPAPTLTTAEAKAHLRVVSSDDDTFIDALVAAATASVEAFTGRALIDQTWDLYLDEFPTTSDAMFIKIPKPPLIEVVEINYDDAAGAIQVIDPTDYYVDNASQPGWVVPTGTLTWPTPLDAINTVRIRFRAGYLSNDSPPVANVPGDIRAGLLLTLGSLYENREQVVVGTIANKLPWGVENLLRPHRVLLGMA